MGRVLAASGVKIFQIETTLNSETFPSNLGFLNKREWEWSAYDQGLMMAAKKGNDLAPPRVRREFYRRIEAPYKLTGHQRRRGRGGARAHPRRTCTVSSSSRWTASPTC